MADTIIRLKTLDLQAAISTPRPAYKRRVFSDQEWQYLNNLPTIELIRRVGWGQYLINLLHNPAILNITPAEGDKLSSNLKYQIEAINHIIKERTENHGGG